MPQISVVIPAYNAEKYIGQAVESLLCQTFTDWECIIINDGSTDSTLEILKRYAMFDIRLKVESIPNSGSAKVPRDRAIAMAQSSWILALDADDYLAPQTLEALLQRQQQTNADIVILRLDMFDDQTGKTMFTVPDKEFDFSQILSGEEAVMKTIGRWQISGNGLFSIKLFNARCSVLNGWNYMNTDEYDTRDMFIKAERIAFVNVSYYYRQFCSSITKSPSYKLFEPIFTNRMLVRLLGDCFGRNSQQERLMLKIHLEHLFSAYFMYVRMIRMFSEQDRLKAKGIITSERKNISDKEIKNSDIDMVRRVLFLLPDSWLFSLIRIYCLIRR